VVSVVFSLYNSIPNFTNTIVHHCDVKMHHRKGIHLTGHWR